MQLLSPDPTVTRHKGNEKVPVSVPKVRFNIPQSESRFRRAKVYEAYVVTPQPKPDCGFRTGPNRRMNQIQ